MISEGGRSTRGGFGPELRPRAVETPHQWREPCKASLDEDDAQPGKAREAALGDEADDLSLKRDRHRARVLDVVARESRRGDGVAPPAAVVDADRQPVAEGCLVDRPVLALSERFVRSGENEYLDEPCVLRNPVDLRCRRDRILVGNHDRCSQPTVAREPLLGEPVICGFRHHACKFEVEHLPDPEQRVEECELDVPPVEQLCLHEFQVRCRWSTRPGATSRPAMPVASAAGTPPRGKSGRRGSRAPCGRPPRGVSAPRAVRATLSACTEPVRRRRGARCGRRSR